MEQYGISCFRHVSEIFWDFRIGVCRHSRKVKIEVLNESRSAAFLYRSPSSESLGDQSGAVSGAESAWEHC
jgi:hypothetical protein